MPDRLPRRSRIGIVGGGQLGRMLASAGARLGYRCTILEPESPCPAGEVADRHLVATYDDPAALDELAASCDVVTYEFENVDADAVARLHRRVPVHPPVEALVASQDRLVEKELLAAAGLRTTRWYDVPDVGALRRALDSFGGRGLLKTRRFGYDGKGQIRFAGRPDDPSPEAALAELGGVPCILEQLVAFEREISVIATRGLDGRVVCFDPARNEHADGILVRSTVPSGLPADVEREAIRLAVGLLERLRYVGTLGLELFVTSDGELLANEYAPRVHNSGHWTEAACAVSQFEQHVRAICGWPLAPSVRHSDCVMHNVLGDQIDTLATVADDGRVVVHDYGKQVARAGRKMGHLTRISPRLPDAGADGTLTRP